jgi:hypothetical protein
LEDLYLFSGATLYAGYQTGDRASQQILIIICNQKARGNPWSPYGAHYIAPNTQHGFDQQSPIRLFAVWLQIKVSSWEVKAKSASLPNFPDYYAFEQTN